MSWHRHRDDVLAGGEGADCLIGGRGDDQAPDATVDDVVDAEEGDDPGEVGRRVETTMDLTDLGTRVDAEPPPPARTTDIADLLANLVACG